jgi:hypothetical protein
MLSFFILPTAVCGPELLKARFRLEVHDFSLGWLSNAMYLHGNLVPTTTTTTTITTANLTPVGRQARLQEFRGTHDQCNPNAWPHFT